MFADFRKASLLPKELLHPADLEVHRAGPDHTLRHGFLHILSGGMVMIRVIVPMMVMGMAGRGCRCIVVLLSRDRRQCGIMDGIGVEHRLAAGRAKEIAAPTIVSPIGCCSRIDLHAANGVFHPATDRPPWRGDAYAVREPSVQPRGASSPAISSLSRLGAYPVPPHSEIR